MVKPDHSDRMSSALRDRIAHALEPHMPYIHPGDESNYTPEETREVALDAADAVLRVLEEEKSSR